MPVSMREIAPGIVTERATDLSVFQGYPAAIFDVVIKLVERACIVRHRLHGRTELIGSPREQRKRRAMTA